MIPRHRITELFSTFAQFADDRFANWVTDGALRRSMLRYQQQTRVRTDSETFWVLYWYKFWQEQPNGLATGHLAAYLQEACYWAAHKLSTRTASLQSGVSDCFQIAIAALPTVLRGYDLDQGASLKTYASLVFSNTIRDSLRQQREANSRTDWGLLRKLSQKQLLESLEMAGFSATAIAGYRLAWISFKTVCTPRDPTATRQLSRPTPEMWQAIANFYNAQREQLSVPISAANPELLERWLLVCAKQVRAYLHPTLSSLNLPKAEGGGEIQDDLPDREDVSPLVALISQEDVEAWQAQRLQVNQVLMTALQNLNPEVQFLLKLYCHRKLTQQEIAAELGVKQYTVSRRLSSAREQLLLALAKWSQETLHISLNSTVVKGMSAVLEEWLQETFSSLSKDVPE